MAKTKNKVIRTKRVRTTNKHLPPSSKKELKQKEEKLPKIVSEEIGIIVTPIGVTGDPIESPDPKWIHRMEKDFPNGVRHFKKVLKAHGFYTFDDACNDYHENPEPFRMFFKSTGLALDTENTLEVIQSKLVPGFKKVESDLETQGMNYKSKFDFLNFSI